MSDPDYKERDRQWVKEMQNGREDAFERLFLAYYDDLCAFASQYVSSSQDVEDLVQEVFLSVWERRKALDPQQSIRAYLYKATRNGALKNLNREQRWPTVQRELQEHSLRGRPGEQLEHSEVEADVWEAVNALPERRREIFLLSRQHGLTYAEVAELLDISIKTVETQMGRALRYLEEELPELVRSNVN